MVPLEFAVKLFASVREAVGSDSVPITLEEGARVRDMMAALASDYPGIAAQRGSLSVAVNQEIVRGERVLLAGDEVALIPPVGGG